MTVRRVVTGQTAEGRSVFVSDEALDPITVALIPGTEFFPLWGSDEPPRLPAGGHPSGSLDWFPPAGGFRFAAITLGPDVVTKIEPDPAGLGIALEELRAKLPGLADVVEPDSDLHRTDTVDLVVVLSGEVVLELDDGAQVPVRAGDCVVQNGTRHTWRNTSTAPCVMAVTILGAPRA